MNQVKLELSPTLLIKMVYKTGLKYMRLLALPTLILFLRVLVQILLKMNV
jgi:hypothetical protein